jgi:hypothetical protein
VKALKGRGGRSGHSEEVGERAAKVRRSQETGGEEEEVRRRR